MVTPDKIRIEMAKMDALLEAFERSFLHLVDAGVGEEMERERGTMAFYALRDLAQKVILEMEELSGHMEVCDAVMAVNGLKKREGQK